ncbi:MAG: cytochrome c3 family protein [Cyanobacteria bacterium P01_E01_bin.6]
MLRRKSFFSLQTAIIAAGIILLVGLVGVFALETDQQTIFLPGETSEGHFLFEASCASCHEGFKPVTNETCMRCHEAEMADDKHGPKKFRDPRWAADLEKLEVLTCTTCHNEHVHMFGRGVHLQPDLCMACHQGIIEGDMQSHDGFTPDGCWTAGCHNFHDHRSISTGFLADTLDQPPMLPVQELPILDVITTLDSAPDADLWDEFLGGES